MKILRLPPGIAVVALGILLVVQASAQDPVDNVVVVLDCSGSMAAALPGSKLDKMTAAKTGLKQVLQSVPPSTHIGLLVFSAKDVKNDWVYPLGPRDDAKLNQAIDPLQPSGGTPLGAYLKKGADRLLEARTKQFGYGTFRLLVVTDGEAGDKELVERFTPEIVARGITVDVIGVGMSQRHTLATKVHSYRSVNDPASLKRAVAEVFGEVGGSAKDAAVGDAFADLAPIPTQVAQAMIQALSTSGNQPIGDRVRSPAAATQAPLPRTAPATATAPAAPPRPPTPMAQTSPGGGTRVKSWALFPLVGGFGCFGVFALVVVLLILNSIKKSRR